MLCAWFLYIVGVNVTRFFCLVVLLLISVIEIGPIPISPLVLLTVVLFRPMWFYHLVLKIYGNKSDKIG